jgi:hypothetical protein
VRREGGNRGFLKDVVHPQNELETVRSLSTRFKGNCGKQAR